MGWIFPQRLRNTGEEERLGQLFRNSHIKSPKAQPTDIPGEDPSGKYGQGSGLNPFYSY